MKFLLYSAIFYFFIFFFCNYRNRRQSSTTRLSEFRNTRVKGDLEKVSEDGREKSGGSTRRRRNRPSKQEEKIEEVYHESFCKPGTY